MKWAMSLGRRKERLGRETGLLKLHKQLGWSHEARPWKLSHSSSPWTGRRSEPIEEGRPAACLEVTPASVEPISTGEKGVVISGTSVFSGE
ncbi:hypothetical protein Nepgr_013091 [Nepenthes gracilis]|uniref:Uncharacterized protein n=1 Tax=Nepenthes gracilis TaxID=150966 RepID=A0AAD3XP22_NEPGR|nr:hypothetical protein Nepgr_013091 [Nepenthes gracilis]